MVKNTSNLQGREYFDGERELRDLLEAATALGIVQNSIQIPLSLSTISSKLACLYLPILFIAKVRMIFVIISFDFQLDLIKRCLDREP